MLRNKAGSSGAGGVSTSGIKDNAVTTEKLQDIESQRLLGRGQSGVGDPQQIKVGNGITFTGEDSVGLSDTGVTADTYGSATEIPIVTVDAKGRVTAASVTSITAGISGLLVTGDTPGPVFVTNGNGEPIYV